MDILFGSDKSVKNEDAVVEHDAIKLTEKKDEGVLGLFNHDNQLNFIKSGEYLVHVFIETFKQL